jgi:hypothetical protein
MELLGERVAESEEEGVMEDVPLGERVLEPEKEAEGSAPKASVSKKGG